MTVPYFVNCAVPVEADGTQTEFAIDLPTAPIIVSPPFGGFSPHFDLLKPKPTGVIAIDAGASGALSSDGYTVTLTYGTAPTAGPQYLNFHLLYSA